MAAIEALMTWQLFYAVALSALDLRFVTADQLSQLQGTQHPSIPAPRIASARKLR